MDDVKKYKRSIQGTSNRLIDINGIVEKGRARKHDIGEKRHHGY